MRTLKPLLAVLVTLFILRTSAQTGATLSDSILSGGTYRKYKLYIPSSYNGSKAFPLLINLHGLASSAIQQQLYSDFMPIADTADFLIVHPEGSLSGSIQYWNAGVAGTPNDVAFISALIDSLGKDHNMDKDRVYSCGLSNGGILSYYLSCMLPNKIAAIASVAGTMFRFWYETCHPKVAVPVMEIHGTEDMTVPYEGNSSGTAAGLYVPVDTIISKWVFHNKCNSTVQATSLPDINTTDLSTVLHYRYTGGVDGSEVELYKVVGGSHSWPGATPVIYKTNQDFSASKEIWRFFRKYKLSQFKTNVGLSQQEQMPELSVYPNPSDDVIHVKGVEVIQLSLYQIDGSLLANVKESDVLDTSELEPGLYILKIESKQGNCNMRVIKE